MVKFVSSEEAVDLIQDGMAMATVGFSRLAQNFLREGEMLK